MDFGRLSNVDDFDFSFPPEPVENEAVLHTFGGEQPLDLYVGAPQWTDPEWPGQIYPRGMKAADTLKYYGRQFNCVELNTTFYRIPTPKTVEQWKNSVPAHFRFTPKIPQAISHDQLLFNTGALTHAFVEVMRGLGETLGPIFLQLPQPFGKDQMNVLKKYLDDFPRDVQLAVEFRHASWFSDRRARDEIFSFMQERNIGTVITDTAGRRDVLHLRLTNTCAFIRFAANNGHPTDAPRLAAWAEKIARWKNEGLETVYFFLHSPQHTKIPELSNTTVRLLNEHCAAKLKPCVFIDEQQPELF